MPNGHETLLSWGDVVSQLVPVVQTVVAVALTYVSKLLRDVRNELSALDRRLARLEVRSEELEKRIDLRIGEGQKRMFEQVQELRREQDALQHRMERMTELRTRGRREE